MKIPFLARALCISAIGLHSFAQAQAAPLPVGKVLSAEQVLRTAVLSAVIIDGQTFKVVAVENQAKAGATAQPVSVVINERGVVGHSRNEVVVSQVPTSLVRQRIVGLGLPTVSVKYYSHMNISTLRFASLDEAAQARTTLMYQMPQARIDVPIQFSKPRVR